MRKFYYNSSRKLTLFLLALMAWPWGAAKMGAQSQDSLKTSALESHEGMTISARPWTNPALYKERFHKKRSEEHTSELQSLTNLVCRLLLEKKKKTKNCDDSHRSSTYMSHHRT